MEKDPEPTTINTLPKQQTSQKEEKPKKKRWINPLRDRTRVVPFVVPTHEERMSALGSLAGEKWRVKKSLLAIVDQYQPIKTPQPGDNLYELEEDGQGFGDFASRLRNHIDLQTEIIYIATFCCKISKDVLRRIRKQVKGFFHGVKVKFHDFSKVNLQQFDPMLSEHQQKYYDAAKINQYFQKHLPKKAYSIAVITNLLIYNGDNPRQQLEEKAIYGLGAIKDRTSIISFQEICKKGYGNQKEGQDQAEENIVFLEKVVNHQLCHTFGMKHCIYFNCLMNGSNNYQEASGKVPHLCPICLRKLQHQLQFDFAERFQARGDEKSLEMAQRIKESFAPFAK